MSKITLKAAVATKQAIWDYDPEEEDNLINGGVDVIAIIRTLAVKVSPYSMAAALLNSGL